MAAGSVAMIRAPTKPPAGIGAATVSATGDGGPIALSSDP